MQKHLEGTLWHIIPNFPKTPFCPKLLAVSTWCRHWVQTQKKQFDVITQLRKSWQFLIIFTVFEKVPKHMARYVACRLCWNSQLITSGYGLKNFIYLSRYYWNELFFSDSFLAISPTRSLTRKLINGIWSISCCAICSLDGRHDFCC